MRDLYVHERHAGAEGIPKLSVPPGRAQISGRELFRRRCYLLGITNPDTVASLWAEEEVKIAAKREMRKRGRRGTSKPGQARS